MLLGHTMKNILCIMKWEHGYEFIGMDWGYACLDHQCYASIPLKSCESHFCAFDDMGVCTLCTHASNWLLWLGGAIFAKFPWLQCQSQILMCWLNVNLTIMQKSLLWFHTSCLKPTKIHYTTTHAFLYPTFHCISPYSYSKLSFILGLLSGNRWSCSFELYRLL